MTYRRTVGPIVLAVLLSACNDSTPASPLAAPEALASGAAHAYVVQEPGSSADRVTLTIRVVGKDVSLAAYQGRLEYTSGSLVILEATVPSDGTRLVNASAGPGVVKFAGFSTDAFASTVAATLVVKPLQRLELLNLRATLDVAGERTGAAVAKSGLVPTAGVYRGVVEAP